MLIQFHCLYWDNISPLMISAHQSVMQHFQIDMNYSHNHMLDHGVWMTSIMNQSSADLVVCLDIDCVPMNMHQLLRCCRWAYEHDSFVGLAQVSNHLPPKSHVYAAPGFYCMSRMAYEHLGRPCFATTARSDVAEEVSYIAEANGLSYRALRPELFDRHPAEGIWRLSCLGCYGIGTVFEDTVYHLYEAREGTNIDLFLFRCNQIIQGRFDSTNMISSTYMQQSSKLHMIN